MEANDKAEMREADASRSDKILQAKSGFVVHGQEVFGRYCKIEMMRYGAPNEFFIHKCITILNSNFYTDVPVVCGEGNKWHDESVEVVSVITCGVDESKVFRVPLKDVEFVSMPSNCYGQSDQMTSYGNEAEMREALGKVNEIYDILSKPCIVIEDARQACREARGVLIPALDKPPRQCDVGTANEQAKRLNEWCNGRHCVNCQFKGGWPDECKLRWVQTPYVEEDSDGGK